MIGYQCFVTISIIKAVSTKQITSKQKLTDPLAFQDSISFITEIPECSLLPITYLSPCCLWHSLILSRSESTFAVYLLILHGILIQVNNRIQLTHCPTAEEPKCMDSKPSANNSAIQIKLIFSSCVRKLNNLLLPIPPILFCSVEDTNQTHKYYKLKNLIFPPNATWIVIAIYTWGSYATTLILSVQWRLISQKILSSRSDPPSLKR